MAIVFAVRADNANFAARYSSNSTAVQTVMGTITHDVDATAINGYNYNLAQSGSAGRCLAWPFRGCLTTKEISVLLRAKISSTALQGFWQIGQACGHNVNNMMLYTTSNLWALLAYSSTWNIGVKASTFSGGGNLVTGAWCDIVITWDGTNAANALKLWIDGVNVTSETMTNQWVAPTFHDTVSVGGVTTSTPFAHFVFEEFVIWNEVIDPTAVTLDSGSGSLNGPSRTSLVTVSALNGGSYTDPGEANVKSGESYTYAGAAKTGTYSASCDYPSEANVRNGTSFGSGAYTGTLVVPSSANVRSGISVDGTTGSLDVTQDTVTVLAEDYESITVDVEEQP